MVWARDGLSLLWFSHRAVVFLTQRRLMQHILAILLWVTPALSNSRKTLARASVSSCSRHCRQCMMCSIGMLRALQMSMSFCQLWLRLIARSVLGVDRLYGN